MLAALWAGTLAGLAAAVPLGAIGLLVVDRGLRRGLAAGLAAAAGVATVDAVYAGVAVTVGAGLGPVVERVQTPASLTAAAVLVALAVVGLRTAGSPVGPGGTDGRDEGAGAPPARTVARTYVAFVGLTSLNPATVLTFAAVAVAAGDRLSTTAVRAVFVLGVGVASLAWQAVLATGGALLGRRPRPRLLRATRVAGAVLLLVLAGALVVDALV